MLARQVERRKAIARLDDLVAMGFEEVIEQLHVQFIVFDNEHGFGLRGHGPWCFHHIRHLCCGKFHNRRRSHI